MTLKLVTRLLNVSCLPITLLPLLLVSACGPPEDDPYLPGGCSELWPIVAVGGSVDGNEEFLLVDPSVVALYEDEDSGMFVRSGTAGTELHLVPSNSNYYLNARVPTDSFHHFSVRVDKGSFEGSSSIGSTLTLHDVPLPSGENSDFIFDVLPAMNGDPYGRTLSRQPTLNVPGELLRLDLGQMLECG